MPSQVWLQCHARDVQRIKALLGATGQLDRVRKVKQGREGLKIIPTNIIVREGEGEGEGEAEWRGEGGSGDSSRVAEVLSDLGITPENQVLYLPSPTTTTTSSSTKPSAITNAISQWLDSLPPAALQDLDLDNHSTTTTETRTILLTTAPKRWSVYPPLLLLPSTTFHHGPWPTLLHRLPNSHLSTLWTALLQIVSLKEIGSKGGLSLTHLAINSSIPLTTLSPFSSPFTSLYTDTDSTPNILRTPTTLHPLHGDFGPILPSHVAQKPSSQDFELAFWVATKQNGIWQTWAPRYTMFSRGNIKEKARLLSFVSTDYASPASTASCGDGTLITTATSNAIALRCEEQEQQVRGLEVGKRRAQRPATAIDLYAGIGYFTFSYAYATMRGVYLHPILAWELNAWSVEGLRRGAALNGWSCVVLSEVQLELLDRWELVLEKQKLDDGEVFLEEEKEKEGVKEGR